MAFRKRFVGSNVLFYTVMAGLMVPGVLLSLGLATLMQPARPAAGLVVIRASACTSSGPCPSVFLVMMAVFNRFDASLEEAARDMGASEWTVFKEVTLPLILPGDRGRRPVRLYPVLRRVRTDHAAGRRTQHAAARHQRLR